MLSYIFRLSFTTNMLILSTTLCLLMPLPHVNYVKPSVRRNHGFFAGPLLNYTIPILPYSQPPERVHPVQAAQDSSKVLLQASHVGILHLKAEKQVLSLNARTPVSSKEVSIWLLE